MYSYFSLFFCAFSKITDLKNIYVSFVFKAELKPKHEEEKKFGGGVFFKNQKCTFTGVQNGTFKMSNFKFVFLHLFFNVKRSFMPIFTQKILIFVPPGIFWNFGIGLLKLYLIFGYLTCFVRSKQISTLHPSAGPQKMLADSIQIADMESTLSYFWRYSNYSRQLKRKRFAQSFFVSIDSFYQCCGAGAQAGAGGAEIIWDLEPESKLNF